MSRDDWYEELGGTRPPAPQHREWTVPDLVALAEEGGVESLDALHAEKRRLAAERAELVRKIAPSRALRLNLDARRRSERGKLMVLVRHEARERGEKEPAASALPDLAAGDPRYVEWCDRVELELAELEIAEDRITAIGEEMKMLDERINRGQGLLRLATSERYSV